jgi:hypothetical protein
VSLIVQRCTDAVFIDFVIEEMLEHVTNDQNTTCPPAALLMQHPDVIFLEAKDSESGVRHGIWMVWAGECHTVLLPSLRGAKAFLATRKAIEWMWQNTDLPALTTYSYDCSPHVELLARRMGFVETEQISDGTTVKGRPVVTKLFLLKRPT